MRLRNAIPRKLRFVYPIRFASGSCCSSKSIDFLHPLEPLTSDEVLKAVSLMTENSIIHKQTRIISIYLKEPLKQVVYKWDEDKSTQIDRVASAVIMENSTNTAIRANLNLSKGSVISVTKAISGSQPTISADEMVEAEQAVLDSELFKDACFKHYGIKDLSRIMVDIWSVGNYGDKEDRTMRLSRPLCFIRSEPVRNF